MGLELIRILYLHLKKNPNKIKYNGKIQTYHSKEPPDKLSRCLQSAIQIMFSEDLSVFHIQSILVI